MDEYPSFVLKGMPPWDGVYEWDTDRTFNVREWRYIKKISGYLPETIDEGMKGDDPELYVALAIVCMVRAGKVERDEALRVAEQVSEVPWDNASLTVTNPPKDEEKPEDVPLELTPPPDAPSPNVTDSRQNSSEGKASGSGRTSTPSSAPSDENQERIGTSESDAAAVRPLRWAN